MTPVAYYALFQDITGIALRDHNGQVHFQAEATGLWQTLTDADAPALILCGRVDLAAAQQCADARFGSLYAFIDQRNSEHAVVA